MYIHEAIAARTDERPYITRESWKDKWYRLHVRLLPTNTSDGMVYLSETQETPRRGWQPRAEELLASDWIATN